jgi:hypothetical protein
MTNANNFVGMTTWESGGSRTIVCPVGINGMELYDTDGILYDISPSTYGPQQTDFHGQITATCDDGRWLYYFTKPTGSNTKTKLMATRYEYINDSDWRLHSLNEIDLNPVNCAWVSSLQATNPRLWYAGSKSGVVGIGYIILATVSDPSADSAYRFTTDTSYLYSSWKNCGTPGDNKVFFYNDTQTASLAAGQTVTVGYEIDSASIVTLAALSAPGTTRSYYAVDKTGKEIRHKYTLTTNDNTKTPVLLKDVMAVRNAAVPCKIYKMRVKTAGEVQVATGGVITSSKSTVDTIAAIDTMADYHYVKMTHYVDDKETGTAVYISIVPPSPQRIRLEAASGPEYVFELIGLKAYTS